MSEEAGEGGGWLDEDDARDGEGKAGKSSNVIQCKTDWNVMYCSYELLTTPSAALLHTDPPIKQ